VPGIRYPSRAPNPNPRLPAMASLAPHRHWGSLDLGFFR